MDKAFYKTFNATKIGTNLAERTFFFGAVICFNFFLEKWEKIEKLFAPFLSSAWLGKINWPIVIGGTYVVFSVTRLGYILKVLTTDFLAK